MQNWSIYSFGHNKMWNRLGVEKTKALVYIYTNSRLLYQRPYVDLVHYYDDNILEDSNDDSRALSKTDDNDNNDNNGNGGKGDNGNNGDSFVEEEKITEQTL